MMSVDTIEKGGRKKQSNPAEHCCALLCSALLCSHEGEGNRQNETKVMHRNTIITPRQTRRSSLGCKTRQGEAKAGYIMAEEREG